MNRIAYRLALIMWVLGLPAICSAQALRLYFIDVEGGQATLVVTPSGQSMLVDTGWGGFNSRDADRIASTARKAGIQILDYVVITHYHDDHVGGVEQLARRLEFRTIVTHGPTTETGETAARLTAVYSRAVAMTGAKELVVRPGDRIPIEGLDVTVVASNRQLLAKPLTGGAASNPLCDGAAQRRTDTSDNSASVAMLMIFGRFRLADLGDLTQDIELDLACPANRIGQVDLYLTTHHGSGQSNARELVHALKPRVAIMNNGARKGGDPEVLRTVRTSPGLEDLWMLHYSIAGGGEGNVVDELIANTGDVPDPSVPDRGFGISVSVQPDGSFTVVNERNSLKKSYPARP